MAVLDLGSIHIDEERARAYVLAHGGIRDQARLMGILSSARPDREVVKTLEGLQNPDGGFPLFQQMGNPSSVDTTCYILAQLKDMPPLAGSPMASRAIAFLRRSQHPDGYWRESDELQPMAPPWSQGEGVSAKSYLTANATYTILTLEPAHMDPVIRGERWLRQDLEPFPPQGLALAFATWYKLGHFAQADQCFERFLQAQERDPSEVAWWLSGALEVRVGGPALVPILRQLAWLAGQQQADGSWGFALESTLQALRVFRGFGLI